LLRKHNSHHYCRTSQHFKGKPFADGLTELYASSEYTAKIDQREKKSFRITVEVELSTQAQKHFQTENDVHLTRSLCLLGFIVNSDGSIIADFAEALKRSQQSFRRATLETDMTLAKVSEAAQYC